MSDSKDAVTGASIAGTWFERMRAGDFDGAWEISDAVLKSRAGEPCWHWPRHQQYVWDGRPLEAKRVLIRCYHGLGDTVMFIRYAPLVKAIAREVIVWAQRPLLPLLRSARGIDRLLPLHDGVPEVPYDADVEVMELPHVFRSTLASLPADVPYLSAAPATLRGNAFNVGLVWSAGDWDRRRSISPSELAPLADLPGIRLHLLQRGAALREWTYAAGVVAGHDRPEETAGVMRALDLVISVDSFPAHLAGALGVKTWLLLHADPDWRWMRERDDSPWYPTLRLFRQRQAGDWGEVIGRVRRALTEEISRQS